ncbi:hypothetical protein P7C70_g9045, partial [Phenoliferia sp. Uapishka_3]
MFTPTDIVVVTGSNGHLAQHTVDQLLSLPHGPRVRGTVRTEETKKMILQHYRSVDGGEKSGRLEVYVVKDMLAEGAFDEVVRGATHIAHVASPLVITAITDVSKQLLDPAIQGTVGILKSAKKSGSVRAVVITSSFGAVFDPKMGWRKGHNYTSADWNPATYEGAADPNLNLMAYPVELRHYVTYCASKVLAEKAAW